MEEELIKLCCNAKYKSDTKLCEDIWCGLVEHQKRINKLKLFFFSILGTLSVLGFVPLSSRLLSDLARSGFYEYSSLIFSDGGLVIFFWREFVYSLTESIPIVSLTLSVALVFIFVLSLRYAMKQIIINMNYKPLVF